MDTRLIKFGPDSELYAYDPANDPETQDVWSVFAFTDFGRGQSLARFVKRYGPPGSVFLGDPLDDLNDLFAGKPQRPRQSYYYPVARFLEEQAGVQMLVLLYENRQRPKELIKILQHHNETGYRNRVAPSYFSTEDLMPENIGQTLTTAFEDAFFFFDGAKPVYDPTADKFSLTVTLNSLLDVIYWQFQQIMLAGETLRKCENPNCYFYFLPSHGHQKFHSPKCRQAYYDRSE